MRDQSTAPAEVALLRYPEDRPETKELR